MKISGLFFLLCLTAVFCSAQQPAARNSITVYTTAEKTDYRLTRTDAKPFVLSVQPLETEICVFVNPEKTFQVFLGIGGAITDAAAEVFAKLPAGSPHSERTPLSWTTLCPKRSARCVLNMSPPSDSPPPNSRSF